MDFQDEPTKPDVSTAADWFWMDGDVREGPATIAEIGSLIGSGSIETKTIMWRNGMLEWVPANQIPEILNVFAQTPTYIPRKSTNNTTTTRRATILNYKTGVLVAGFIVILLVGLFFVVAKPFNAATTNEREGLPPDVYTNSTAVIANDNASSADSAPATTVAADISSSTTVAPIHVEPVYPTINGLYADDARIQRRVVGVKIDNHASAQPQSGIQVADAVYEVLVEGGLTRFIALFHQSDSEYVGPNRSGRPTDSGLMNPLHGPFQISGAQPWVRDIFRKDGTLVVYDNGSTTFRVSHRKAPHNLFTSTVKIREYADNKNWPNESPGPLFVYDSSVPAPQIAAETITFDWSNHPAIIWKWDGEQYFRFIADSPHNWVTKDGETGQISVDMLVVIKGTQYTASSPTGAGSSVPAIKTTGSGDALIFYKGGLVEASWARDSIQDKIQIFDLQGKELAIPPGRVWVNIFPKQREISWK